MKAFFVLIILSISVVLVSAQTAQTITFPEFPVKGYGDATFTLNATASSGLAVTYYSSNTTVATVSGSTVTIKTTGYSFISALQAGNGSYAAATPVAQLLVVCPKATLSVTANDKTMVVGTTVPTLTYTITGYKNNQTSSVVSGTPVFQALGSNLTEGTYPIVINKGILSATNYEFQLIDGLLTVNKDTATPIVSATDSTIKVYPNPAKDFLMVENAENDVISIIDFSGKEVYSTKILNSAARIDVSKLNQGVYILKVNKNHQNYAKTLLINR